MSVLKPSEIIKIMERRRDEGDHPLQFSTTHMEEILTVASLSGVTLSRRASVGALKELDDYLCKWWADNGQGVLDDIVREKGQHLRKGEQP